jgi:hypothetical protein
MAVRGDSPILIQWAGGHTNFKTTQGYIARGQTERRRIGEPLPPLPPTLLRIARDENGVSRTVERREVLEHVLDLGERIRLDA